MVDIDFTQLTISERIKYLRKEILNLTQQKFVQNLNISRSNLAGIETGDPAPTDRVIKDICRIHNANEEWITKGIGEPLVQLTKDQELANFVGSLFGDNVCPEKKQYIESLSRLPDEWFIQTMNAFKRYENEEKRAD